MRSSVLMTMVAGAMASVGEGYPDLSFKESSPRYNTSKGKAFTKGKRHKSQRSRANRRKSRK